MTIVDGDVDMTGPDLGTHSSLVSYLHNNDTPEDGYVKPRDAKDALGIKSSIELRRLIYYAEETGSIDVRRSRLGKNWFITGLKYVPERERRKTRKKIAFSTQSIKEPFADLKATKLRYGRIQQIPIGSGSESYEASAPITVDELSGAIEITMGASEEDARETAKTIAAFFGYSSRIIDNRLNTEDRDIFWTLEDKGLLTRREEEETLPGRNKAWRVFYWIYRKDKIRELLKYEKEESADLFEEAKTIYEDLPDNVWERAYS